MRTHSSAGTCARIKMKLEYPKEWFERSADIEAGQTIGAGCPAAPCSLLRFSRTDESRIWAVAKPCKTVMVEVYDDGNVVLLVTDGEKTEVATIVEANTKARQPEGSAEK